MPAKLPEETERWNGRLWAADMELLRVLYPEPGQINEVVRACVRGYANGLRRKLGASPQAAEPAPAPARTAPGSP